MPQPFTFPCIHYVEGKEGFSCLDTMLMEAAAISHATVETVDVAREEARTVVQHSF